MKIPLSWLREYLPTQLDPEQIAEKLTLIGLEVENVEAMLPSFHGVVVAKVESVAPHPQADKLRVATVYDGTTSHQVVCGAANCRAGIKVAFARVGAVLGATTIKQATLRGVVSEGMLCASDELGLPDDGLEGIMELSPLLIEGSDYAQLYSDFLFEIALTPNLGHCASMRGVARELAMGTQEKMEDPLAHRLLSTGRSLSHPLSVQVVARTACPRYACRLIEGVKVAPSPDWLRRRLELCGLRSVNNVVDSTNLVLLELGHPLHAFDRAKMQGEGITVRYAKEGEKLDALDQKIYSLTPEMLAICDGRGPIAIAGIMGGIETEIREATQAVWLESAYFEPTQIRRTRKQLDIMTQASHRFERGTDPNGVIEALNYATYWICKLAGGVPCDPFVDDKEAPFLPTTLPLRCDRVNRVLGTTLAQGEIETLMRRLHFGVHALKADKIQVTVPTYRHDIRFEIDLIEEVARLYGFDSIYKETRAPFRLGSLSHTPAYHFEQELREALIGEGLQEFLTCNLIGPQDADLITSDTCPSREVIPLRNPHSLVHSLLRPSLLPGLLGVVRRNYDQGIHALSGFEIGKIHFKIEEQYYEPTVVSLIGTGLRCPCHWDTKAPEIDFFDLKGIVENVLAKLAIATVSFHAERWDNFHPGRQAAVVIAPTEDFGERQAVAYGLYLGQQEIGMIGEVHPLTVRRLGISQPIYFAELYVEALHKASNRDKKMMPLPHYPSSVRDWTVTVEETLAVGILLKKIQQLPSKLLESVLLLDVYRGEHLGWSKKNITLRFVYRDPDKTLSAEAVEREHARILRMLMESEEIK